MHVNLTLLFSLKTHSRFVLVTSQTCPTARYMQCSAQGWEYSYPFLLNQLSPILHAMTWLSEHLRPCFLPTWSALLGSIP